MSTPEATPKTDSIQHPQHPVPDEVKRVFDERHRRHRQAVAEHFELARLLQPSEEARAARRELLEAMARLTGTGVEKEQSRAAESRKRLDEIRELPVESDLELGLPRFDLNTPVPASSTDHHFWWSHTETIEHDPFFISFVDGLGWRIFGRYNHDGAHMITRGFGIRAFFELHWERVPQTPSGWWASEPHVMLAGGLLGWTLDGGIFSGDFWSNAWITFRQTVFQPIPGGAHRLGEGVQRPQVIHIQDYATTRAYYAPGHQPIPAVSFTGAIPGISIWAEVAVHVDIQLEGDSGMWTGYGMGSNNLVIQNAQWPLRPLP